MLLEDFLARLPHEPTKPNGETMCRCPAHADKRHSLSVRQGERGIVVKCFAGCETKAILDCMGLKLADLYQDEGQGRAPRKSAGKPDPRPVEARVRTVPAAPKPPLGKLTATYPYKDADGHVLFEVLRYAQPDGGKTFLQRVPDANAKGGYRWSTKGVPHPLYRLPEVLAAIQAGRPVYLVEGEKDADTLHRLGMTATTNPGGADQKGAKWLPEHTESLRGADVIILPDIDEVGLADRTAVAARIYPVAKQVRMVDLRQGTAKLPDKGDITDYVTLLGDQPAMDELAKLVAACEPITLTSEEAETLEESAVAKAFEAVKGYCVKDGCICKYAKGGKDDDDWYPKPLCTFTCLPVQEVTQDDGVSRTTLHVIDGWDREGRKLPQVRVMTEHYRNMGWVGKAWGFRANILPGNTVADSLRYAIAEVGYTSSKRVTEYTHMGWRKIGERWTYLYQGGAIGMDGVTVELGDRLQEYTLGGELGGLTDAQAAGWSMDLRNVISPHIAIPVLATTYLAPLREALMTAGHPPRYTLYLVGDPKAGKSVSAELAQYHFRAVSEAQFPCGFYDTANHVEGMSFRLKDALLVVDDLHPTNSIQERRKMEDMANRLSRQTPRGRMNADGTSRKVTPPRSMSIVTAEYMPNIGESGMSRCYEVEVKASDVPKDGGLTAMQEQGQMGTLRKAMRGYIAWLLPQMDQLPQVLSERFKALRAEAQGLLGGDGTRMSETIAMQLLGYEMMCKYMQTLGVVEYVEDEMRYAKGILVKGGQHQTSATREERPSQLYLNTINDLLINHTAELRDLMARDRQNNPLRGMIGYKDTAYYYLIPGLSYTMVCEQVRKSGVEFPLSAKALWKQMASDKLIAPAVDGSTSTRNKAIDGKPQRLLWVYRAAIDGIGQEEQVRMIVQREGGADDLLETEPVEPAPGTDNDPLPF